jgi:hypothetical protein
MEALGKVGVGGGKCTKHHLSAGPVGEEVTCGRGLKGCLDRGQGSVLHRTVKEGSFGSGL